MKPLYTNEQFDLSKSKEKLPCECYNCKNTFYVDKSNIKHELTHNRGRVKFCSVRCNSKYVSTAKDIPCANCGKVFLKKQSEIKQGRNNFCSMNCAGTFNGKLRKHSDESKLKITESLKRNPFKIKQKKERLEKSKHKCPHCEKLTTNIIFCSRSCAATSGNLNGRGRKGGLASVSIQSKNRRSKNEIYFAELCEQRFSEVKFNEPMFNGWDADVIIEDLKLAVLWNGKWHYEKITEKHSVEQVQNRDKIKLKEIAEKGYESYVIKDMGKYKKTFVEEKFKEMLAFLKL